MSPESNSQTATLIDGLAALRDRYISMLSDAEHQAEHAKVQLVHLNALLVDQMFSPGLAPANLGTAEFQPASSSAALPPAAADIPVFIAPAPAVSAPVAPRGKKAAAPKAPVTKGRKAPGQMSKSSTRETVLPLLPPYGGLTKIQAVQRVMEEHSGKEIHLDEVIRILHGELDKITLRQERGRMRNLMWRGADRKLWDKIRGKDSYYTLKMSLLTSSPAAKTTTGRGRGKAKAAAEPVAAATAAPKAAKAAKTTTRAPKAPKAAKAAKPVKAAKPTRITKAAAAKAAKAEAEAAAKATAKKETPIRIIKAKDAKPARGATKAAAKATAAPSIDAGSSLMGSVEQVLRANKGKSMTAEEIATAIFGNLDRNMLTQVKKQISDRLAKGVKYKRWQRVPNKIGSYIYA